MNISIFLSLQSVSLASWFHGFLFSDCIFAYCFGSGSLLHWFFDPNQILHLQLIWIRISLHIYWQHINLFYLMQKKICNKTHKIL